MPIFTFLIDISVESFLLFCDLFRFACSLLRQGMKQIIIGLDAPEIKALEKAGDKVSLSKVWNIDHHLSCWCCRRTFDLVIFMSRGDFSSKLNIPQFLNFNFLLMINLVGIKGKCDSSDKWRDVSPKFINRKLWRLCFDHWWEIANLRLRGWCEEHVPAACIGLCICHLLPFFTKTEGTGGVL